MTATLSSAQMCAWQHDGFIVLPNLLPATLHTSIRRWVSELHDQPGTSDGLLQYDETTRDGDLVRCRTENFIPYHQGLESLCQRGDIPDVGAQLFGEPAVLYKEKINYKNPGGSGFAAHQDAPAYPNVQDTLACLIAVDDFTFDNGCLEVARGQHARLLPTDSGGCIAPEVADDLVFEPLRLTAGSVVFFHCYLPHRSGPNLTEHNRRAIYLTFNRAIAGDLRAEYYANKIAELAKTPERISMISHFTGSAQPAVCGQSSDTAELLSLHPDTTSIAECITYLQKYFINHGQSRYDEAVTQLEHGLQSIALAEQAGYNEQLQAACLLHDIGHLMIGEHSGRDDFLDHDEGHEDTAFEWLTAWFGAEISNAVRLHVAAKRYIVATNADYAAGLSKASTRSLAVQGGPMNESEVAEFEREPGFKTAVALRMIDDQAKLPGRPVPRLDHWTPLLERVVKEHLS